MAGKTDWLGERQELGGLSLPLATVFGDAQIAAYFSVPTTIAAWLAVERALAVAQAEAGVIPRSAAEVIEREAQPERIDLDLLQRRTELVGYPILPLLEQLAANCSPEVGRYVHWGATTQDIMDSGMSLQVSLGLDRFHSLLVTLGEAIATLCREHRHTLLAGRTHAQHAVPTTLGAKLAVWLAETSRHVQRVVSVRPRVTQVQLFGAAGTNAALGLNGHQIRNRVAELLGLMPADVPWHVGRDSLAELGFVLAAAAATCAKIAREVINLSRPEIAEVAEEGGHLRGASSTMPQKANPVRSESVVGLSAAAQAMLPLLFSAMQAGHERAAGEWQAEWDAVPCTFVYTAGAVARTSEMIAGLSVFPERMLANLTSDGGLIMAEQLMMRLAPVVGRTRAHELVYEACVLARDGALSMIDAVAEMATNDPAQLPQLPSAEPAEPSNYLGEVERIVDAALADWETVAERS